MTRLLLLLPLIVAPPVLTAGYFLYVEPTLAAPTVGAADEDPARAARTAYDKADRLLGEARQSEGDKKAELLKRAAVQYRVCLAYETAVDDAGHLFADARHNLEAGRLLLVQGERVQLAQTAAPERKPAPPSQPGAHAVVESPAPPKAAPKPVAKAEPKPPESTPLPPKKEEPKPALPAVKPPKKIITAGPDGVIYERIEK